jgi:small subunit ribosomal protein S4
MARYTGPKWRIARREQYDVFGDASWRKRPTLPGQHPNSKGRPTNYAIQFREKQKVKRMYGMLEKQFRNLYELATKSTGNTGLRLLQLLETRLDNVVYRLGYAKSINQARQFVSHNHIFVNGKKLNIASYQVKVGDEVTYSDKFLKNDVIKFIKEENKAIQVPKWLESGKVDMLPTRDMIDKGIKESLIIEFYSR